MQPPDDVKERLDRAKQAGSLILENVLELGTACVSLVMVERALGMAGLGIFSFLLAFFKLSGLVVEWGVPRRLEHQLAAADEAAASTANQIRTAAQAAWATGLAAFVVSMIMAARMGQLTRVDEIPVSYALIGLALWARNVAVVRLGALHGSGRHDEAASIDIRRRLFFLVTLFLLTRTALPASWLSLAFLISEWLGMRQAVKAVPLAKPRWKGFSRQGITASLRAGTSYVLTREVLEILFFADLFILGLLRSDSDVGLFAQVSVMVKGFLLLPLALRPMVRRRLTRAAQKGILEAAIHRVSRGFFWGHAALAVLVALGFSETSRWIFGPSHVLENHFRVFSIMLPGLVLFAVTLAIEPIYEALDETGNLRSLILRVSLLNGVANFYLIPYAGVLGAAFASCLTMLAYFFGFGFGLNRPALLPRMPFVAAGAAAYLVYWVLQPLGWSVGVLVPVVPVVLALCLHAIDFFSGSRLADQHGAP